MSPGSNHAGETSQDDEVGTNGITIPPGKSGRVIEKLMAENDRLRRELRSETAKREEESRRGEAARMARDSLQSMNENLIHQTNVDKTSLTRKERKLEELKMEREEDRTKRLEAETNLKKYVNETNDSLQNMKETLTTETFERERALRQYDTLTKSWKHLEEGYRTSLSRLKKQIEDINGERKKDKTTVQKLEVIVEQQRQEIEKMRSAKKMITLTYEERIREMDVALAELKKLAMKDTGQAEEALEEARRVAGELKHLLAVKQSLRPDP